MKNTFIIFVSIFVLIFSLFVLALSYMFYNDCTKLIAGNSMVFFSGDVFLTGLLVCFPLSCLIAIAWVFFYCIRNNAYKFSSAFISFLMIAFIWVGLLPLYFSLLSQWDNSLFLNKDTVSATPFVLSSNYFRETDLGVYYFSHVSENNEVSGVLFPQTASVGKSVPPEIFADKILPPEIFSSKDPLIAQTVEVSASFGQFLSFYRFTLSRLLGFWQEGWFSYAKILVIIFAFAGLWGFSLISSWRLINALLVVAGIFGIIYVNFFILNLTYFTEIKSYLMRFHIFIDDFQLLYSIILNSIVGVIGVLFGIISTTSKKRHYSGEPK